MSDAKEITRIGTGAIAPYQAEVQAVAERTAMVQECMRNLMVKDTHYGVIPGCQKPSLWQPGTDILGVLFRLRPEYDTIRAVEEPDFISFTLRCRLLHIDTGREWGSGVGSANSRETKYAPPTKAPGRICPHCKGEYIQKGREEYGGGWICFAKKGGCGAKFRDGDKAIEGQAPKKPEPLTPAELTAHIYNLHNTILKIAAKRAKVSATLTATAASDIFTQDLEDIIDYLPPPQQQAEKREPHPFAKPSPKRPGKAENMDRLHAETVAHDADGVVLDEANPFDETPPGPPESTVAGELDASKAKSPQNVTNPQLAKIHVLKAQLEKTGAIKDDDEWRARLGKKFGNGVTSSAQLSKAQAADLIDALEKYVTQDAAKGNRKVARAKEALADVADAVGLEYLMKLTVWGGNLGWTHDQTAKWITDHFPAESPYHLTVQQQEDAVTLMRVRLAGNMADYEAELASFVELGRARK